MRDDTYSFIVRIWSETTDSGGRMTAWRGSIEPVGGQQKRYFRKLETLCFFIEDETGMTAGPRAAITAKLDDE